MIGPRPYGPWIEALRRQIRAVGTDSQEPDTQRASATLAAFDPSRRSRQLRLPSTPRLTPEEERLRIYDAVTQTLLAAAEETAIVLVLDDLHWADRASLGLLQYLARFVRQARLLIVGVYRDLEVQEADPLRDVLAALGREPGYERLLLQGLTYAEVGEYLTLAGERSMPDEFVRAIRDETDGNPFFIGQVLRHLVEEGRIIRREGRWPSDVDVADLGIPEGVREVVRRRLSRLSAETKTMLRFAAAFPGGGDLPVLQVLTDLPEERLLDALDEALQARLFRSVRGDGERYEFIHALVRTTLHHELNPSRKARLHRRIAEVLERVYAGHSAEHAAELAYHHHGAAILAGSDGGIVHCLAAAEAAEAAFAHEQAAVYLRMARDLAGRGETAVQAPILCRLAVAEAEAVLLEESQVSVDAALTALAAARAEPSSVADFLARLSFALMTSGAGPRVWLPLVRRGLSLLGEERTLTWARLMLLLDPLEEVSNGWIRAARGLPDDAQAVAIARAEGDEDDYARTLRARDPRSRVETDRILALARRWQRPWAVIRAIGVAASDLVFGHGALRDGRAVCQEMLVISERYGSLIGQAEALTMRALIEISLGEFPAVLTSEAGAEALMTRLGRRHFMRGAIGLIRAVLAYFRGGSGIGSRSSSSALLRIPWEGTRTPC